MDELVRWLGEQLDEDERIAKRAATMKFDLPSDAPWERARLLIEQGRAAADERHIAEHDPARVLREIEAKRDLLRFAEGIHDHHETFMNGTYSRLEGTLRLFAAACADRPGYREEWRP